MQSATNHSIFAHPYPHKRFPAYGANGTLLIHIGYAWENNSTARIMAPGPTSTAARPSPQRGASPLPGRATRADPTHGPATHRLPAQLADRPSVTRYTVGGGTAVDWPDHHNTVGIRSG